ncbi:response regulator [Rudaeicoccus suwonensis]|uniref:LuxR family two component transcriptional regulator n=1 Tax=Rudaeicoccus suwonensis TaxID=657409 RepID=A0A561EBQ8_9MICO|nr:response regulator transcription factor [Rudaeicoccus suwonensis]TWE13044.1 LuxR family two component transcriptional regulator [Rudaeicoccus suwonensis]
MTQKSHEGDDPITVLLVDDDALVRAGLRVILRGAKDISVLDHDAANGQEALAAVVQHRPDVVLMDVRMPVMDGIEATAALTAQPDPPQVIVLTTFDADDLVVRALRTGASGFLLKDTPPERLVDAVRSVAAGEPILSPSVTRHLLERITSGGDGARRTAANDRLAALTAREREVAELVGQGLSNADIAKELFMSVPTVKAHVSRVLTKLGADNRVQVAIVVHESHLPD